MNGFGSLKKALKSMAPYAGLVAASLAILAGVLRLWKANFHVPFAYSRDALCMQMWVKGIVDNGWCLHNPFLSWPGSLDMEDFPVAESLHFAFCKLISWAVHDHVVVFNLYYLVGFPLSALSAFWVMRRLGVSYWPGLVGSLLFAFTPYHFFRGENHIFLSAYHLIPLVVLLALKICQGWNPWSRGGKDGSPGPRSWLNFKFFLSLALCVLVGSSGVYYAFFACFLLLVAGIWAGFQQRTWAGPLVGGFFIAAIMVSASANLLPSILYHARHGANPDAVVRYPTEAEDYSLKINNLLLPMPKHRLGGHFHPAYTRGFDFGTNLGIVGGCGFVILVGRYLFGRYSPAGPQTLDFLGVLAIASLLLATAGGFGYLFSLLITAWIRCYYRMAIFLSFFSLFAVALVLDKLVVRIGQTPLKRPVYSALCLMILLGGIWDQTNDFMIPSYRENKDEFRSDAEFVRRIEALIPHQAVFQLPCVPFPESCVKGVFSYDLFRGYLHSHTLRWSAGAVKGRSVDYWQKEVSRQPADKLVEAVALAGFGGIYLDRQGFADGGASLLSDLERLLQSQPLVSANQRLAFFELTRYRRGLRERLGESEWQRKRQEVLQPVSLSVSWRGGFSFLEGDPENNWRWCSRHGTLEILNASCRPMEIVLEMSVSQADGLPANLRIDGPGFSEHLDTSGASTFFKKRLKLSPGRHFVEFHNDGEKKIIPEDSRDLVFRLHNFRIGWLNEDGVERNSFRSASVQANRTE